MLDTDRGARVREAPRGAAGPPRRPAVRAPADHASPNTAIARCGAGARGDTTADLDRPVDPATLESAELFLIKVGWWTSEPNGFDRRFGHVREVKVGTTLAVDAQGVVRTVLRGGQDPGLAERRDAFLGRLSACGALQRHDKHLAPYGEPLAGYVRSVPHSSGTRFTGGLRIPPRGRGPAMSVMTVTAYNVGFGDAILVEFPELTDGRSTTRRLMIDMGNVAAGSDRKVFGTIAADVLRRLDGSALDLFVMTHEHLDHVRGMRLAASMGIEIPVDYVWLTASANPRYGKLYPKARAQRLAMAEEVRRLAADDRGAGRDRGPHASALRQQRSGRDRRQRRLPPADGSRPTAATSTADSRSSGADTTPSTSRSCLCSRRSPTARSTTVGLASPMPRASKRRRYPPNPDGVDRTAFRALVRSLEQGSAENMLAIDRAANNTSVVLCLEWRGWRLLFAGDAEHRSWQEMVRRRRLKPVHFLKISHHGSHNGTPKSSVLNMILPVPRPDDRFRSGLLSTWPDTYSGVPDAPTSTGSPSAWTRSVRRDRYLSERASRSSSPTNNRNSEVEPEAAAGGDWRALGWLFDRV